MTGSFTPTTLPDTADLADRAAKALAGVGVDLTDHTGDLAATTPVTGGALTRLRWRSAADVDAAVERAHAAHLRWRSTPAPARGALVKRLGQLIAAHTDHLATLIQIEVGKTRTEAVGEVVEIVDICDLAVGLARQLNGSTLPSERPQHRILES